MHFFQLLNILNFYFQDSASENKTEETGGNDGEKENNAETKDDLDFSFSTKKKKKKKKPVCNLLSSISFCHSFHYCFNRNLIIQEQ